MEPLDDSKLKLDVAQAARWSDLTVPYLLERSGLDPERPAIVMEGRHRTYGELRDRSRRLANGLVDLGIEPMDRVAVLSCNCLEFIEIEVGIAGARAVMVPLNWRLKGAELTNLLQRSEARAILVEERFLDTVAEIRGELPQVRSVIALPSGGGDLAYEELCASASAERPARRGRMEDPHEIIYTSGTTGEPKGATWSNGTLIWNSIQQVMDYGLTASDSTYAVIDLYYIGGRHDFTWPVLHQGGTVHIKPSSGWDAREVISYVAEHGISHVLWVPTMLYDILRLPGLGDFDLSRLRAIMCGGAPVSKATAEQAASAFPSADFLQVYGLTEGGGNVTIIPAAYAASKAGSAGKASMHNEIRIVDDQGRDRPRGEAGEIVVRGPAVTAGYWDAAELTARTVVDGWLHTGDMGYLDDDDFLFVSGRKKDMIISGGMNIFPAEIEDILRRHPAVADVAVIGVPDEKWGERVCAVIEAAEGTDVVEQELIDHCREQLAGYKKPSFVKVVGAMPRTVSGKPKKFLLKERFADLAQSQAAPRG